MICVLGVSFYYVTRIGACGPDFPNNLLEEGDAAVLVAPQADFARELKRMDLVQPKFTAQPPFGGYAEQTADAEFDDLKAALRSRKTPDDQAERILREHQAERTKLRDYLQKWQEYRNRQKAADSGAEDMEPAVSAPEFPSLVPVTDLPQEFADYLAGAFAWRNPTLKDKRAAREAWERVLALPPAERRYKSVWAAFMLGKSWEEEDPEKALAYFTQTRELAKRHFIDSAGLAAASLGLEARVHLKAKRYEESIEGYVAQLAADDQSAVESLRVVANEVLQTDASTLVPLAKNPRTQRVITAYIISLTPVRISVPNEGEESEPSPFAERWLKAVAKAEVHDVESAEKLALLAYQHNDMKLAGQWIERAPGSPIAAWLRAKLLLRAGKLDQAASLLTRVVAAFPLQPHNPTNEVTAESLKDTLKVGADYTWPLRPVERQVLGELGVLRLTRREYVQALDALLRAGFWTDAAYVAERVLSLEELKSYVDREWPAVSDQQVAEEEEQYGEDRASPVLLRRQIRYVLARRLTREIHGDEAREYYPAEWVSGFDALARGLRVGWDESVADTTRAQALFEAAIIARTNGMELLGTEVQPDWHVYEGNFEGTLTSTLRATNPSARFVVASKDEVERADRHHADPEARFHYRYQAASLAWEAANLLPNNSDITAYVLWTAGTWLKGRDPHTADLFYKALVRRNRQTALGAAADVQRWFPRLDDEGNILPRYTPPQPLDALPGIDGPSEPAMTDTSSSDEKMQENSADSPNGTPEPNPILLTEPNSDEFHYIVHQGDSIGRILQQLREAGVQATWDDLRTANPGLDAARLKVGQKISVPIPSQQQE